MRTDLDIDSDGTTGQVRPGYLEAQLPDASVLHLNWELQEGQTVGSQLEVDEKDVSVQGTAADIIKVQVLHYLPQVGVEDVGEECVEHLVYSLQE